MSIAPLTPILTATWDAPRSWKLDTYRSANGYAGATRALRMPAAQVIDEVKASGLRGRGGAGFPTGTKWSFVPAAPGQPKYLVVNCDESEPGTCKDMPLLMASPHLVVEGAIIAGYAIGAHRVFIYIRGEVVHVLRRVQQAVAEAYQAGLLGPRTMGVEYPLDITVHAGAGAYICGEETALLDSLEGRRGQPRSRPPFPAVAGLYGQPTVVNNCETIASLPAILARGAAWYAQFGTEQSKGATIYSLSGHVRFPGQFEAPFGTTARTLLELAGGIREGHKLKFFTPGGSSTPLFTEEQLDVPLSYEAVADAGSMLGTKALQFFDETTSVLRTTRRWMEFYAAESCGKCTPCREGSWWLRQLVARLEEGRGKEGDVERILDICGNVSGKTFCPLADGFVAMVTSAVRQFRSEFEAGYRRPASELFPYERSAVFKSATSAVASRTTRGGEAR
ncbi:MAG: NADH-quinone oxidoreductase subunit NuoF [Propionibacteriaceae bacterium]|jgi:NADH-quinone oxidoreductase subunit F|nr:NADH-quinone oxidoreductase subunit NuoF [Propionibacteriaceae bacterium]